MTTQSDSFTDHKGNKVSLHEAEALGFSISPRCICIDFDDDESIPPVHYVYQYNRINGSLPQPNDSWIKWQAVFRARPKENGK
jgi:hypothetical protein